MSPDPYSPETRRLFFSPVHSGVASADYGAVLHAEASESRVGAKVALSAAIEDELIVELRFKVFGCPHLIAAAEWLCAGFQGQQAIKLGSFSAKQCMVALDVPVEKTGRILLVEDAVRGLADQIHTR